MLEMNVQKGGQRYFTVNFTNLKETNGSESNVMVSSTISVKSQEDKL